MVSDARVLMSEGVGFAAICSNDAASYPEDSFENMARFATAHAERQLLNIIAIPDQLFEGVELYFFVMLAAVQAIEV